MKRLKETDKLPVMTRTIKLSLKFITAKKRRAIAALLESYRSAVNFYVKSLWSERGGLNKETLARLANTRLSERYKSQALKQALETVIDTKRSAKALGTTAGLPHFNGSAILDAKFVTIEAGRGGSFDLIVKLSTLRKGRRICLPTRKTKVLNKWLEKPEAALIQGCSLSEDHLIVFVEIPEKKIKTEGTKLGIDLGVHKLVALSDGTYLGTDFKSVRDKIVRRKPGSKGKQRALRERANLIGRTLNQIDWSNLMVLGVEKLHDMKRGKQANRGKSFRKALAPWVYRQVITRIENKAQENRVRLVAIDPRNTSRTCPSCGVVSKDSRRGENFNCVSCGYKADADFVGAQNVLARTLQLLGSVESPGQTKDLK